MSEKSISTYEEKVFDSNDRPWGLDSNGLSKLFIMGSAAERDIGILEETNVPDRNAADTRYFKIDSSLSELSVANRSTARASLGLGDAAVRNVGISLSTNLLDRQQLDTRFASRSLNLSDLSDASQARNNLGLGTAAEANIGTDPSQLSTNTMLNLGNAANRDVGTAATEVPLNSDLGTAAYLDAGDTAGQVSTVVYVDQEILNLASQIDGLDPEDIEGLTLSFEPTPNTVPLRNGNGALRVVLPQGDVGRENYEVWID